MPLTVAEPEIKISDFTAGLVEDVEEAAVPPTGLLEATNVLIENVTGTVRTREGYRRVINDDPADKSLRGYNIKNIHPYNHITSAGVQTQYLILVCTTNASGADNVVLYALRLSDYTLYRISPTGLEFDDTSGRHYGFSVDNIFYGGSEQAPLYSWVPTGGPTPAGVELGTWTTDVSTPNYPLWVTSGPAGNQVASDYAFTKGYTLNYNNGGDIRSYTALKDIRYKEWEQGTDADPIEYERGEHVSRRASVGGFTYWRSYRCIKRHNSTTTSPRTPPNGTFWKPVKLDAPIDAGGERRADIWREIPEAPETSVAVWHGDRLFAVHSQKGRQVLIYSRASDLKKSQESPNITVDLRWNPKDWRTAELENPAGWEFFETSDGDKITALFSFGHYLMVFKEKSTWVLAGRDPNSWSRIKIADAGCVGRRAVTQEGGFVYWLSDEGIYRTDGTEAKPVPGADKVFNWVKESLEFSGNNDSVMWTYENMVHLALPTGTSRVNDAVLVYDPITESFWKQDLSVNDVAIIRKDGKDRLFFSVPTHVGVLQDAKYTWSGTPHRSTSVRTISGTPVTNFVKNPDFQATQAGAAPFDWTKTHADKVVAKCTTAANIGGGGTALGLELTNKRADPAGAYEGVMDAVAGIGTGNAKYSIHVRRPGWKRHPTRKPDIKIQVENTTYNSGSLSWSYIKQGFWRASVTHNNASADPTWRILVAPDTTVHVDAVMATTSTTLHEYFDGDGGYNSSTGGPVGGGLGLVMMYDHPDADHLDDLGKELETGETVDEVSVSPIGWEIQSSWFPFSEKREERLIRRVWALVRGDGTTVGIRLFRNYKDDSEGETWTTAPVESPAHYFEGNVVPVCFAIKFGVAGLSAPAAVLSIAAETEFRRVRHHR